MLEVWTTQKRSFSDGPPCISAAPAALDRYLAALPAMSLIPFAPFAQQRHGAHLLALAVRFVDRQIFVARRTECVEHAGFFDRLNTVRHVAGEIV